MASNSFNFKNDITGDALLVVLPELSEAESTKAIQFILKETEASLVRFGWNGTNFKEEANLSIAKKVEPIKHWAQRYCNQETKPKVNCNIGKTSSQKCVVFECSKLLSDKDLSLPNRLFSIGITQRFCTEITISDLVWPYFVKDIEALSKRVMEL